jgi:hypothetical protein
LSKFIRQKSPKKFILDGLKFLVQRPNFITRLDEIFCQEFATLGDAVVGAGLLARSHILRVGINILTFSTLKFIQFCTQLCKKISKM